MSCNPLRRLPESLCTLAAASKRTMYQAFACPLRDSEVSNNSTRLEVSKPDVVTHRWVSRLPNSTARAGT